MRRCRLLVVALAALVMRAGDLRLFPHQARFLQPLDAGETVVDAQWPVQISDYVTGGRIELSLRAYVELVLANNPDIAIAKLQVLTPINAISRAYSAFDPGLQASFTNTRSTQPTSSALQGANTLKSFSQPLNLTYQQMLSSGTSLGITFDTQRTSTNNAFSTFNPAIASSLTFQFEQPLFRNRWASMTRTTILIARSNLSISKLQVRDQVSTILAAAENVYWDVVQARENVNLQARFLELREAALERAQKQVDAGALLTLDLFQPKSEYASAQVSMSQARQALSRSENTLRQQIGADLDPKLRDLPILLTEPISAVVSPLPDRDSAVRKALAARADRLAVAAELKADDLSIRSATEALRPSVSLIGGYASQGLGGVYHELKDPFGRGTVGTSIPGGWTDALGQVFGYRFPVYSAGIRVRLPLRDRSAAADLADAEMRKRLDQLRLRKLEQSIRLQVLNALGELEAAQASMRQAEIAREFAGKRFAAEQKKYELGVTQLFFVLDAQTRLNQAEDDLLRQSIIYRRNLIALHLMTGELLNDWGVDFEQAHADWRRGAHTASKIGARD